MKTIKENDMLVRLNLPEQKLPRGLVQAAGILKGKRRQLEAHLRTLRREWARREEKQWRLGLDNRRR